MANDHLEGRQNKKWKKNKETVMQKPITNEGKTLNKVSPHHQSDLVTQSTISAFIIKAKL